MSEMDKKAKAKRRLFEELTQEAQFERGFEAAREAERRDTVAWLRAPGYLGDQLEAADLIERGEHVGAADQEGGDGE